MISKPQATRPVPVIASAHCPKTGPDFGIQSKRKNNSNMYSYDVILIGSGLFLSLGSVQAGQTNDYGEIEQFDEWSKLRYKRAMPPVDIIIANLLPATRVSPFGGWSSSGADQPTKNGHSMLWHVGVYSKRYTPYMQICGGTLVTMKAVISAAHCFWSDVEGAAMPAEDFAVGAGKRFRPWNDSHDNYSQKSEVSEIHIPVRYHHEATSYQEDIAILILTQEFTVSEAVRPACVNFDEDFDNEQLKEGNLGTILGWGLTEEDGKENSPILNFLELPAVSIETCLKSTSVSFLRYITSDKICAGVTTGKAICRGDSGGGLVFTEQRGSERVPYLRGVASTAPRNEHRCNAHALSALTHVRAHQAFLRRYIPNLEDECKRQYPQAHDLKVRYIPNLEDECKRHYPQTDVSEARYSQNETAASEPVQVPCHCDNATVHSV